MALCSWGQWLDRSGTSADGSSGSGMFVHGGFNFKSVDNDSGLIVVASVLL